MRLRPFAPPRGRADAHGRPRRRPRRVAFLALRPRRRGATSADVGSGATASSNEVGRGGMGAVFAAVRDDGEFEQKVALKIIKSGLSTATIVRRFRHERQILASLEHPNIARLLDGGMSDDGLPFYVMEFIEGEPIDEYCRAPSAGREGEAGALPAGLRRRLLRPPAPHRPPRPQAVEHPRHGRRPRRSSSTSASPRSSRRATATHRARRHSSG